MGFGGDLVFLGALRRARIIRSDLRLLAREAV